MILPCVLRQSLDLAKAEAQRLRRADVARHVAVQRMQAIGTYRVAALAARFARQRGMRARLQRRVPVGAVDVDRAHLDPVLAQVAHDLRRRIEAHGLRVEQRRREHVRIAALEPGRGIDQQREARGVAFREAVFAEAFDLAEAALGEVARIASRHHALDHLGLERADGAGALEGRHGAAQLVGFARREAAGDDGDLHRLFLEQRHAQRLAEDGFELLGGIRDRLESLPAAQIGMHHVALDRARPHDRDLDDEIVELLRLEPRQHRHLRAALDLEHAERVGALQHAVDGLFFHRDRREREEAFFVAALRRRTKRQAVMRLGELERLAQAGQHAEPEHVDLEDAERVEIVLVPFDEGAVLHRAVADRHHLVEPAAGDDEAADVLGEMAGERLDLVDQRAHLLDARTVDVDAGALELGGAHRAAAHAPDRGGERADRVLAQPEGLADFADRGASAIGDDGRGDAGMVASVALVDVLDHLLAPLVLEIDVDVGRLAAILGDEALEQQAAFARVDVGDAQAVADRRVRRRAAALAEDVLAARIADDVMHGEEVGRVIELRRSAPAHARGSARTLSGMPSG